MVVLAAPLVPGLDVAGFLPALALALILTVVTTTVNVALAIEEDVTFYAELARRRLGVDRSTRVLLLSTEGITDTESYARLLALQPRA